MAETIFQKIIDKEIPADIIYEDEHCLAFKDINPVAPIHALLIPKKPIAMLHDVEAQDKELMGHLMTLIPQIARDLGLSDDYRVVINNGEKAQQTVFHLHIHIIGQKKFSWPPG